MDRITEGDTVTVYFDHVDTEFHCKVLYTPCATGDSWHLQRKDGTIVYVNSFSKMVKGKEAQ